MTRLFQIAMAVAAIGLFLWAMFAHGGTCGVEQQDFIFAVAYGQYGSEHGCIAWPDHRPNVRVVSQVEICGAIKRPLNCRAQGWYHDEIILLVDTLDFSNVEDTTVLMHEYIHWLQELRYGPAMGCLEIVEREREAYRMQAYVLYKADRSFKAQHVEFLSRQLRC